MRDFGLDVFLTDFFVGVNTGTGLIFAEIEKGGFLIDRRGEVVHHVGMQTNEDSRLVWSDERGGAVGDKPAKAARKRKASKKNKGADLNRGGFPNDGVVRVCREKSGRGGKTVTVLYGVPGTDGDRQKMLKTLKARCGCGGTLRESFLEIQGDQRDKILAFLEDQGLDAKSAGG